MGNSIDYSNDKPIKRGFLSQARCTARTVQHGGSAEHTAEPTQSEVG